MKYDDPLSVILYSWQKENNKNKLEYGVSITDECISLEQTKELLEKINNFRSL